MPGLIVELAVEDLINRPLEAAGFALITSSIASSTMSPGIKIDTSISRDGGPVIQ